MLFLTTNPFTLHIRTCAEGTRNKYNFCKTHVNNIHVVTRWEKIKQVGEYIVKTPHIMTLT
jgi:hypothetical protein